MDLPNVLYLPIKGSSSNAHAFQELCRKYIYIYIYIYKITNIVHTYLP